MTEQEELATWREVGVMFDLSYPTAITLGGGGITINKYGGFYAYKSGMLVGISDKSVLSRSPSFIECVFLARQKLQQEAEAALSPNERRYKKALEEIEEYMRSIYGENNTVWEIASKALNQTPCDR